MQKLPKSSKMIKIAKMSKNVKISESWIYKCNFSFISAVWVEHSFHMQRLFLHPFLNTLQKILSKKSIHITHPLWVVKKAAHQYNSNSLTCKRFSEIHCTKRGSILKAAVQ